MTKGRGSKGAGWGRGHVGQRGCRSNTDLQGHLPSQAAKWRNPCKVQQEKGTEGAGLFRREGWLGKLRQHGSGTSPTRSKETLRCRWGWADNGG